jgi:hypothetical protein
MAAFDNGDIEERFDDDDAGMIEEDVEAAIEGVRGCDRLCDLFGDGYIGLDEMDGFGILLEASLKRAAGLDVPVQKNDLGPFAQEGLHRCRTGSVCPSRNEGNLPGKLA